MRHRFARPVSECVSAMAKIPVKRPNAMADNVDGRSAWRPGREALRSPNAFGRQRYPVPSSRLHSTP